MSISDKEPGMGRRASAGMKGLLATAAICGLLAGGAMLPHLATADPSEVTQASVEVTVPSGAIELRDNDFRVRLHPDFPQVVDYRIGDLQLAGRLGGALTSVLVNGQEQPVSTASAVVSADAASVTYPLTFPNLAGVSLDVVVSVADDTLTMQFTNLVDPGAAVNRIAIPDLDLVTVGSEDPAAQLTAGSLASGDAFENLATTPAGAAQGSWLVLASDSVLAAAFESNVTSDGDAAVDERWQRRVREGDGATYGSVYPGTWTWSDGAGSDVGRDADPYLRVRITPDANGDGIVDWQDAAVAAQGIVAHGNGADDVRYEVVTRVEPKDSALGEEQFRHTLHNTKIMSLATDNLAQRVLLEGHLDGGVTGALGSSEALHALADEAESWNAVIGFGVPAETMSDAEPDALVERFATLRQAAPDNADWLRIETAGHTGWAGERLGEELGAQGWVVSSPGADAFPTVNIGEMGSEGIESEVIRFVHNATRDGWADHPILSSATAAPDADFSAILDDVWERNLPAKFLQESDIRLWEADAITFANGTMAQGAGSSRTISYDGAVVLTDGSYLLPWYDGGTSWNDTGQERLYHYNPDGGTTEWALTRTWAGQDTLKLYELTDTGREFIRDVAPDNGRVSLEAEAGVAYVLYSAEALPEDVDPGPAPTTTPSPTPTPSPAPSGGSPAPTVSPSASDAPTGPSTTPAAPTTEPTMPVLQYPEKLYQVPGTHSYNGRQWFTRCEPYSQTFRCWTSIWATQVIRQGDAYVRETGWHFNNLTYLPSPRALWSGNELGHTNHWTAADGRRWYTECDTANTGRNGCRSYARTQLVRATADPSGGWTYSTEADWVFNNIVLFG